MSDYPNGVCPFCNEVFERPSKFKTEKESSHILDCRLSDIVKKTNDDAFDSKEFLIYELEHISHISSFGASKGNNHYKRMLECQKLIDKIITGDINGKKNVRKTDMVY